MKSILLTVFVFGAIMASAEKSEGFGYELIMFALDTLQSDSKSLTFELNSMVTKVNLLIEEYRLLKLSSEQNKKSVETTINQLMEEQRLIKSTTERNQNTLVTKLDRLMGDHDVTKSMAQKSSKATEKSLRSIEAKVNQLEEHVKNSSTEINQLINAETAEPRCPEKGENGVYLLKPPFSRISPFSAYCEDGWIVIHRRFNGSLDFNRNWVPYRDGFGDLNGEYWLGLEKMHQITRGGSYDLKVVLKSFEGVVKTATYEGFRVGSEDEQYQLRLARYSGGNLTDSLMHHSTMKFSTPDRNNDISDPEPPSCAELFKSGWWFSNCFVANLNGVYEEGNEDKSMAWYSFNNSWHCLKEARMLVHALK